MAHAHCMLYNEGYSYTHRIYNTYCIYTATMITWTRLFNFLRTLFYIRIVQNIEMQYMKTKLFFRIKPGCLQDNYLLNFDELNNLLHKTPSRNLRHWRNMLDYRKYSYTFMCEIISYPKQGMVLTIQRLDNKSIKKFGTTFWLINGIKRTASEIKI
jgi:hypothetical protein